MEYDCGDNGSVAETAPDEMEYNKIWAAFNEMRLNDKLCDAVLVTNDGQTFSVHKAILAANSAHFFKKFTAKTSPLPSPNSTCDPDYIREDIEGQYLEVVIEYLYNRSARITMENALAILEYAEKFTIKGLADKCAMILNTGLNCVNSIRIWRFAKANAKSVLEHKSKSYILQNFEQISNRNKEYSVLTFEEMLGFVQDDNLNTKNEESTFQCVSKWIGYDPRNRTKYMPNFLSNIRLGLIEFDYFVEDIAKSPYIEGNAKCAPIINSAFDFLFNLQKNGTDTINLTDKLVRPRVPRDVLFTLGGWSGGNPVAHFETYDTRADRWYEHPILEENTARAYHGMALVDNFIYVIGGYDGVVYFNSTRRFNPANEEWDNLSPMYSQRCYVAVVACNGYIYAMGGYDGRFRLNSVERYDPGRNQWTLCNSMLSKRSDAGADTIGGKVIVAGGFDGEDCLSTVEMYSPDTDQWTMCPPMAQPRSGISVVAYSGLLYAIGGFDGATRLATGEKYDPLLKTWEPIKSMYAARSNSGIAVLDQLIFVMGGFNGLCTVDNVECYEPEKNSWMDATDMCITRSAFKACVIRGLPNVRDYTYYGHEKNQSKDKNRLTLGI